jgi:hypothetical protein
MSAEEEKWGEAGEADIVLGIAIVSAWLGEFVLLWLPCVHGVWDIPRCFYDFACKSIEYPMLGVIPFGIGVAIDLVYRWYKEKKR